MTDTAEGAAAPAPARNKPAEEFLRALRRRGQRFRRAEAARKAETQFRIRCERAALLIARKGVDTRVACRAVGLGGNNTKAQEVVKALCDVRGVARRYWWGYPKWQTSPPMPVTVRSRKEVVRRDDDAGDAD